MTRGGGGVQNTPKIDDIISEQPLIARSFRYFLEKVQLITELQRAKDQKQITGGTKNKYKFFQNRFYSRIFHPVEELPHKAPMYLLSKAL